LLEDGCQRAFFHFSRSVWHILRIF
jgi:hypothetical protein